MADNVRGDVVVEPGMTAEYDRIRSSGPLAVLIVGVILLIVGLIVPVNLALEHGPGMLATTAAGHIGFVASAVIAWRLGVGNERRRRELARDISPLREIVVFDEDTVEDDVLWVAAELAEQYMDLEQEGAALANARARTISQEAEHAEHEQQLHELAERILRLVSPAVV